MNSQQTNESDLSADIVTDHAYYSKHPHDGRCEVQGCGLAEAAHHDADTPYVIPADTPYRCPDCVSLRDMGFPMLHGEGQCRTA